MRQVPEYLIIGNGRVSKHFQRYFSLLSIPFAVWHRSQPVASLHALSNNASHILLLISDSAIETFVDQYLSDVSAVRIHCSGSLVTALAYGVHPLFCFNEDLYELNEYQSIPFVIDNDAPDFASLLPGLDNAHVRLDKSSKAKYHALCVLAANFSCLLWQKLFADFEHELSIPAALAHPLLQQQTKNLLINYEAALTGPLLRNDQQTLMKNLQALSGDPIQQVYQSFIEYYQHSRREIAS